MEKQVMGFKEIIYASHGEIGKLERPFDVICNLGFTGRKEGITESQIIMITNFVRIINFASAIHGDCVGADACFHDIVRKEKPRPKAYIEKYPSLHTDYQANKEADFINEPMKALVRDKIMANKSNIMLATPPTEQEILRSGTWATVRYARASPTIRKVIIIAPNGNFVVECYNNVK
jgi:hypothetical protein